jgi:hypothetical protein
MNCLQCNHANPATVQYCQQCGARLDLTQEEIRDTLIQRASKERADKTALNARQALLFGIIMFLAGLTLFLAAGTPPMGATYLPSASSGAEYVEIKYKYEPVLEKEIVPFNPTRK